MPGFHDYFASSVGSPRDKSDLPSWLVHQNKWKGCCADHQLTCAIRKKQPSPRILEHTRLSASQKTYYHRLLSRHGMKLSAFHVSRFSVAALAHLTHLLHTKRWTPVGAQVEVRFGRSFVTFVDQVWRCSKTGRWCVVEFKLDTTGRRAQQEHLGTGMLQGEFRSLLDSQINKDLVQTALSCLAFCVTRQVDLRQTQAVLSICAATTGSVRLVNVPDAIWRCALQWAVTRDSRFREFLSFLPFVEPQTPKFQNRRMAAAEVEQQQPDSLLGHEMKPTTKRKGKTDAAAPPKKHKARQQESSEATAAAAADHQDLKKHQRHEAEAADHQDLKRHQHHEAAAAAAAADRKTNLDDPVHCLSALRENGEKLIVYFADPRNKRSYRSVTSAEAAATSQDISNILDVLVSLENGIIDPDKARETIAPAMNSLGEEARLALDERLSIVKN